MKVQEIPVSIRCLEYTQDKSDSDYGSCLYARFYFNTEKYELNIVSDCGNYSYKWIATPEHESFFELMTRIDSDYLINKLCGNPSTFSYEKTKENFYRYADENDKKKLDKFFEAIEDDEVPSSGDEFLNIIEASDSYWDEPWEYFVYEYNSWQQRIVDIFEKYIQPAIRGILKASNVDQTQRSKMRKVDRSKKSNIKCEHCLYADKDKCRGYWCALHQEEKNYWNRCKDFKWAEVIEEMARTQERI